jgi:transposase
MLKVNIADWQQTPEMLRDQALNAAHPRTRERFLALYEITQGESATQVAWQAQRNPQTVMDWVHRYNSAGPQSLTFRHTGGHPSVLSAEVEQSLDETIREALNLAATPPQERLPALVPTPRWTLKRLVSWVKQKFDIDCCRETLRQVLKKLGFSWKKARKLLNKANPHKRAAFLEKLTEMLDSALHQRCLVVYVDEAHVHLDTDEGYGWSIKGERFWVSSSSPGRQKVSFYGVYLYNLAQVRIFPYDCANQFNTVDLLKRLRVEFPDIPLKLVWDGASYHRAQSVQAAAEVLDVNLEPPRAYSPDFMPVEHLWQWLREDVTYHTCYDKKAELIAQVECFQHRINAEPNAIADRLWVKSHLDPKEEKLRVPT